MLAMSQVELYLSNGKESEQREKLDAKPPLVSYLPVDRMQEQASQEHQEDWMYKRKQKKNREVTYFIHNWY